MPGEVPFFRLDDHFASFCGEGLFARLFAATFPHIQDEDIKQAAIEYIGQEAQHKKAHERASRVLETHGYEVKGLGKKAWEIWGFGSVPKLFGWKVALSVVAGFEHITMLSPRKTSNESCSTVVPPCTNSSSGIQ